MKKVLPNKNHDILYFIVTGKEKALGIDPRTIPITLFIAESNPIKYILIKARVRALDAKISK